MVLSWYFWTVSSKARPAPASRRTLDGSPDWSPDCSRIAFYTDRDGNSEIYVMSADGSNQTRLTNDPAFDANPAWSPDGNTIAFASGRTGGGDIYVMDPVDVDNDGNGDNLTRLTSDPAPDGGPGWQPIPNEAPDPIPGLSHLGLIALAIALACSLSVGLRTRVTA